MPITFPPLRAYAVSAAAGSGRAGATLLLLVAVAAGAPTGARSGVTSPWQMKVDPELLSASQAGPVEALAVLADQANLVDAGGLLDKATKGRFVVERLRSTAARAQRGLLTELATRGIEHRAFWIADFVWLRGDIHVLEAVASRADVATIEANPTFRVPESQAPSGTAPDALLAVEWGLARIRADQVWTTLGVTGVGAVVGGQDTGYQWDHPALKAKYRGWNGSSADHDFNWHDAIHSGGGSCGANSGQPCDDQSHGTHTLGTMVGDDGLGNQIGVAPGAKWIGCRNMDQGVGTPATYAECFQFFVAPTDLAGGSPDPARAPHVINNSWGCPTSEGCTAPDILRTVVENVRAAGIVVVASAGNGGPSCGSVVDPPAIYGASLSVGSTDSGDSAANLSSRGPVTIDGSYQLKPDLAAPGASIRSSVPGGGYNWKSGTSMAGPHVAGVVALVVSAQPLLAGRVALIEKLLRESAVPLTSTQSCGDYPGSVAPNAVFGSGRLDALGAVQRARTYLFDDDFESGSVDAWAP